MAEDPKSWPVVILERKQDDGTLVQRRFHAPREGMWLYYNNQVWQPYLPRQHERPMIYVEAKLFCFELTVEDHAAGPATIVTMEDAA